MGEETTTYLDEALPAVGVLIGIIFAMWRMAIHYTGKAKEARDAAEEKNEAAHAALQREIHENGKSIAAVGGKVDTVIELLKKP